MREKPYAALERRGSRAAVVPLGVIAAVIFLPTYRSCGEGDFRSPANFASADLFSAFWILPVFLGAAALTVLTIRALRRGEVDRASRRMGLGSVALLGMSTVGFGLSMAIGESFEWPWLVAAVAAIVPATMLLRRARGRSPWQIWEHLLAAFAVLALATGPTLFLGGDLLHGTVASLGPGAYLFIGAQIGLWAILGAALIRTRR